METASNGGNGMTDQADVILELKNIEKSFPGVRVLKQVCFTLRRGTVHAIVGENGAGKSTLMKILSGMYQPDAGEIWLEGERVRIANESQGIARGISMIYQELNSVLDMTVMENVVLGREITRLGLTDKAEMRRRTREALAGLDMAIDPDTMMRSLSVASRQMIEIAKAVSREAKIIVMDEPTSSISQREVSELFRLVRKMKARGISVIYISHRLEELPEIADEITIIRDGACVFEGAADAVTEGEIIRHMVGRELNDLFPKTEVPIGEELLRAENFSSAGVFRQISFSVRRGEILGFSGLIGAGRTEVMRAICGLDPCDSGSVFLAGRQKRIKNPTDAIKSGIAMISEDRRRYGLVVIRSIRENMMLAHMRAFAGKLGLLNKHRETGVIGEQIERLHIKTSDIELPASTMSGGNQQKVVLAKWMVRPPQVLIMDEPTKGIDVGAKYEIYKLMCELAGAGMAIIMISSELPEILGMSDRIIVMADGEKRGELMRREATQEKIMALSAGGSRK